MPYNLQKALTSAVNRWRVGINFQLLLLLLLFVKKTNYYLNTCAAAAAAAAAVCCYTDPLHIKGVFLFVLLFFGGFSC